MASQGSLKQKVYDVIEITAPDNKISEVFNGFILFLIATNVVAVILETVPSLAKTYARAFYYFELFSVIVFSAEYLLRLWVITISPTYKGSFGGRLRYVFSLMSIIDLAAILPFYLPMLITVDLRFTRSLRLFRLFRLFKAGRYTNAIGLIQSVIKEKQSELSITAFLVGILIILSSSALYLLENPSQPEKFSSIPQAMWWSISCVTSVGYGDVYPITPLGRVFGALLALLGVALFALPAGILASGFDEALRQQKHSDKTIACPRCGESIPLDPVTSD